MVEITVTRCGAVETLEEGVPKTVQAGNLKVARYGDGIEIITRGDLGLTDAGQIATHGEVRLSFFPTQSHEVSPVVTSLVFRGNPGASLTINELSDNKNTKVVAIWS